MASSQFSAPFTQVARSDRKNEGHKKPVERDGAQKNGGGKRIKTGVYYPKIGEASKQLTRQFRDSIDYLRRANNFWAVQTAYLLHTIRYDILNHHANEIKGRLNGHIRSVKNIDRKKIPSDCLYVIDKLEEALLNYQRALAKPG